MYMDRVEVVARELFGDAIDPRELSSFVSKQNDASEVHVNRGLADYNKKREQRNRRQAQIGLASNIVGLAAGGGALMAAGKDERLKNMGAVGRAIQAPYKKTSATKVGRKWAKFAAKPKVAGSLALGAVGLQAANFGGDIVTNRVLDREANKKVGDKLTPDISVKKSLEDIVAARRAGLIDTDLALALSEEVIAKAAGMLNPAAKDIHAQAEALIPLPQTTNKALKPKKTKAPKPAAPNKVPMAPMDKNPQDVIKSADPEITWSGTISKTDDSKRQVFGYATVTHINGEPVVDLQGDYVPLDEIEKAAYTYVVQSRKGGDMHRRDGDQPLHTADLVESFVITPEKLEKMGLDKDAVPHGWWVGFKVNDDQQWSDIQSGKRTGFSIHGSGKRVEKMLEA
jgi:hypothetical protein